MEFLLKICMGESVLLLCVFGGLIFGYNFNFFFIFYIYMFFVFVIIVVWNSLYVIVWRCFLFGNFFMGVGCVEFDVVL